MKFTEDRLSQNVLASKSHLQRDLLNDSVLESLISHENCPSCLEFLPVEAAECPSCNIVVAQFNRMALERRTKVTIAGLTHLTSVQCEDLDKAWRKVESVYHDSEIHHQFLHLCYQFKAVPYAVKKYSERLEKSYLDDTADMMRKSAVVLLQESLVVRPAAVLDRPAIPGVERSFLRLFNYVMGMSLIGGVVILLVSGLTQSKLFFFGLGMFLILSSIMTLLFVRRELV
jgi:hypothetical protein